MTKHKIATAVTIVTLPLLSLSGASASVVPAVSPANNPCLQQIRVWFAGPAERHMEDISWRESNWTENPKPWRNSKGCLQISWAAHKVELMRMRITPAMLGSAVWNVAYSRLLFARSGLSPWAETR